MIPPDPPGCLRAADAGKRGSGHRVQKRGSPARLRRPGKELIVQRDGPIRGHEIKIFPGVPPLERVIERNLERSIAGAGSRGKLNGSLGGASPPCAETQRNFRSSHERICSQQRADHAKQSLRIGTVDIIKTVAAVLSDLMAVILAYTRFRDYASELILQRKYMLQVRGAI
jgi:hypothetical protein